jgi:hypothetical protein
MMIHPNSAKHLYGRGWLGLIPLFGGFVGIGLMALGIFKYRDKKLILIGVLAFLFTVAVYGSLFYYFAYSNKGGEQLATTSQTFLNSLVKDIEFYKTINGAYPDSLEQLSKNNEMSFIHDPLLSRHPGIKITKFNYLKFEDKYTLFSSGLDRIANTADDIYPSVILSDSTKIGLIKK